MQSPPPPLQARRPRGLFEDLLQARPEVLLQDARENPGAYDDDTLEILRRMYENRVAIDDLKEEERRKLNEATGEFFSSTPRQKSPASPATPLRHRAVDPPRPPEDAEPRGLANEVDPFWWS